MYKRIWVDPCTQISHIVAQWRESCPFTACTMFHWYAPLESLQNGVATCVACWGREIMEWSIEAAKKGL
jgi:hypothetical protein